MDLMKNVFKAYPGKFTVKCTTEDILDAAQFIHQEKMRAKTPQDEFAVSMAYSMAELKKHIVIALGIVIALIIIAVSVNWYEGQNTRNQVNSFISKTQEMGEARRTRKAVKKKKVRRRRRTITEREGYR